MVGAPEGSGQQVALSKLVWGHGVEDWVGGPQQGTACSGGLLAWMCMAEDERMGEK